MRKLIAFTLAEVMIVVVIIGVVAALVLPSFMQDMAERINSHRQANIAQKITKSVELMIVNGEYTDIKNTDDFVNKLTKYLKIAKKCDSEHIADCWPTSKIKTAKGEDYNVADAKTNQALHTKGSLTNNVGLVLADGATLIMTFNPNATNISAEGGFKPFRKELPIGGGKTEEFAYSSNATNAIDFVMDVNGKTGPNAESDLDGNYFDIRSFKTATFTQHACPGGKIYQKTCIVDLDMDYDAIDCTKEENSEYCGNNTSYFIDFFGGANKACDDLGLKLPSKSECNALDQANKLNHTSIISDRGGVASTQYMCCAGSCGGFQPRSIQKPVYCISK